MVTQKGKFSLILIILYNQICVVSVLFCALLSPDYLSAIFPLLLCPCDPQSDLFLWLFNLIHCATTTINKTVAHHSQSY